MAANDGLPAGWEMQVDPSTGRTFYVNHDTMQTSWTPPVETPLPDGWEQQRDAEGRIFFINHNTQVTQWEDPRLGFDDGPSGSGGGQTVSYPSLGGPDVGMEGSTNGGAWGCSACTFENPSDSTKCSVCGTGRDGSMPVESSTSSSAAASSSSSSAAAAGVQQQQQSQAMFDESIDPATAAAIAAAQAEDGMFDTSFQNVMITDPRELQPYVVPDEHSMVCTLCAKPFDWKNRKHHCRCSGGLYCQECSNRKVKFALRGEQSKDRRVCDICFDHQSAGDNHCFLRYVGILRDAGSSRWEDRMLAFKGIAEMIERLPNALKDTASIEDQGMAMRTMDQIERCGGAATLCELLSKNDSADVKIQSCRVIASAAAVAAAASYDSQAPLSRAKLCSELSEGSSAMRSIEAMMSSSDTPWEANMHLAHALFLLGDLFEIQESVRKTGLFPALCEMLLASQEDLQRCSTMAVSRLVQGSAANIEAMLDANGMQALILLLSSSDSTLQEFASHAICSGLALESKDAAQGPYLASRVRDALAQLGGATASVSLLRSDNPNIARVGLQLIEHMSGGQAEVVRAAGAVPLVVALLANPDQDCQASAAQLLRNIAVASASGSMEVLDSGGLSMAIPLLASPNLQAKSSAAGLCEAFASDEKGSSIIMENGAVGALVGLVRNPDNSVRAPAAGALVQLMQCGPFEKQAVVNAGGVEALLGLESSSDPNVIRQLVGAVYSFVSDEALLELLTKRIAPPTLAMKLLGMLGGPNGTSLDFHTVEMLLLVVAVLCGARDGDQFGVSDPQGEDDGVRVAMQRTEAQTKDLVASNGSPLILPLLGSAHNQPALVLAVFRLLLAVCASDKGASAVAKAGGIGAVVQALDDSLNTSSLGGPGGDTTQLLFDLQHYGISLFGKLCSGGQISQTSADDVRRGVRAITRVLDSSDQGSAEHKSSLQLASVRALRELSCHSGNWEAIASIALPQLIDMLLAENNDSALLTDIALTISNLAKLEKHCDSVLDAGAVFSLLNLLSEKEPVAIEAGMSTLCALSESSKRCRLAIVEQGAAPKLLHIAEQRAAPLPASALRCLLLLAREPANTTKITSESGATDTLLRLMKTNNMDIAERSLEILLIVAKDSDTLWEQLVVNADIDSSIALLKLGPPRVQGQACSTIAALCGDSPGFALCSSPAILDVMPTLVELLTPPEHFGADQSESPAKEAAAACALLSSSEVAREKLVASGVVEALVGLLLRERRLGRPRSATSEHSLTALCAVSAPTQTEAQLAEELRAEGKVHVLALWASIDKLGKRRDTVDAIITILDAHIRDTAPTPSGVDRLEICENSVILLGRLPASLSPNEVNLLGRSARSINLVMNEACPEPLLQACLDTLSRLGKQASLIPMLIAAGTIRSVAQLLEPLTLGPQEGSQSQLSPAILLQAVRLLAAMVEASSKERSVDDAIIGTKAIPAIAALLTQSDVLFLVHDTASEALTTALGAIVALAQCGPAVQKAIFSSDNNVLPALAKVVAGFEEDAAATKRATDAILTLSSLAKLDDHRTAIVASAEILEVVETILVKCRDEADTEAELVAASVQLVVNLGPTAMDAIPNAAEYLVQLLDHEHHRALSGSAALCAIAVFAMDVSTAARMVGVDLVDKINAMSRQKEPALSPTDRNTASDVLLYVSFAPEVVNDDSIAVEASDICARFVAECAKDNTRDCAIALGNCVLALCNLSRNAAVRTSVAKQGSLLRSLRSVGVSGETDSLTAFNARKLFQLLGTGEALTQNPRVTRARTAAPAAAPSGPPPSSAMAARLRSNSSASSASGPPPPASAAVQPMHQAVANLQHKKQQEEMQRRAPKPPSAESLAPKPKTGGSLLPTYSNASVSGSSSYRRAPSVVSSGSSVPGGSVLSDEEFARRLQAEENRKSSSSGNSKAAPPPKPAPQPSRSPAVWACPQCTFENAASKPTCEICEAARPSTFGGGSSSTFSPPPNYGGGGGGGAQMVHVRCPGCQTVLGAPSNSAMFKCMKCSRTSTVLTNKV